MVTNHVPYLLSDPQKSLPESLPKSTPQECLVITRYELNRIMQVLKGLYSGRGGGFARGNIIFVENLLDRVMVVLHDDMFSVVAVI